MSGVPVQAMSGVPGQPVTSGTVQPMSGVPVQPVTSGTGAALLAGRGP